MIQGAGDSKIVIKNLGPNELVEIPLPAEGGVTVLRGRNDRGKSEALKAVSVLAGGKDKISVRRGTPPGTKGEITGKGVTVVIHKNVRRTGTAEFEVLDGDLSIEDIVDPGIKDPISADAKRIKALLSVSNAMISPQAFYSLCGGKESFSKAVDHDMLLDPLTMSSKVRAFLQRAAREFEEESTKLTGKAAGLRQAYEGVDLEGETDSQVLQERLEKALSDNAAMTERGKAAERDSERYETAVDELERAKSEYTGKSLEDATKAERDALQCVEAMQVLVDGLRAQLKAAEDKMTEAKRAHSDAAAEYNAVAGHERTMKRLEAVVQSGVVVGPSDAEIKAASEQLADARRAVENGAKVRDARKALLDADEYDKCAEHARLNAQAARQNADRVNDVLNESVSQLGVSLMVVDDRLVVVQSNGDYKLYDELSMGARRKIALDIAIDSVGESGLIPLSQESWEGLDPQARKHIHDHLITAGVNMVTAACSADETVTAEVFDPERA